MGVTVEIYRHGQAGNVRGMDLYVDGERGDPPAESRRADPEVVDSTKEVGLQFGELVATVVLATNVLRSANWRCTTP